MELNINSVKDNRIVLEDRISFSAVNLKRLIQNSLLVCLSNNVISTFCSIQLEEQVVRSPLSVPQITVNWWKELCGDMQAP